MKKLLIILAILIILVACDVTDIIDNQTPVFDSPLAEPVEPVRVCIPKLKMQKDDVTGQWRYRVVCE